MATRRIGLEVGKSYTLTVGTENTIVTALASAWAEARIAELEATLKRVVLVLGGGDGDDPVALAKSIVAELLAYEDHNK